LGYLQISPTATVLNYGQALFEGMKAFRRVDGSIAMFRPERNALRMQQGARRFLLPPVPTDIFVQAADAVVRANARWVPPFGKGALYLRPLLMGTGEDLGVKPSWESTFCIYCSPVGNYFKGGLKAIRLQAVKGFSRAAVGGAGAVKASGNYAPAFMVQRQVRERGYDEVLCLDAAR
jgi:branched-chain amino acid aminotransferase